MIKKNKFSFTAQTATFLCLLLFNISSLNAQKSNNPEKQISRPNVIIILTDDMGFSDISAYGGDFVPTPNIDRIADAGMKLNQYYSAAPVCSPSRVGILTGMYPARWNISTFLATKAHNKGAGQVDFLDPEAPSMVRAFKDAGYATGHFGKWHMGGGRDVHDAPGFSAYGIDEYVSTYESPDPDPLITATDWIWSEKDSVKRWDRTKYFVDKTLDFLRKNKGKPCFVNLWPDDVHTPWVPDMKRNALEFPADPEQEKAFKLVLKEYDVQIGRLLDGLVALGLDKNTIIIFTSDNGPMPSFRGSRAGGLRGTKLSLYEGGTRMPFLISWPGRIPAGSVDSDSEVSATDLMPTLSRLADVTLPKGYRGDGIDRSGVLLGEPSLRDKEMFWEYGRNETNFRYPKGNDRSPNLAIRSGRWKLLMNDDGTDVQLFDIVRDKYEMDNLAKEHPETVESLQQRLRKWWDEMPKLRD